MKVRLPAAKVWRESDQAAQQLSALNLAGTALAEELTCMADRTTDLEHVRRICMGFPEVTERRSHGAPTWFVRDKTTFVTLWQSGHHGQDFPQLWCAAPPGVQEELIDTEPDRYFRPPYVGGRGWIGLRLDIAVDWAEVAGVCEEAYRMIAPKRLVARLDAVTG